MSLKKGSLGMLYLFTSSASGPAMGMHTVERLRTRSGGVLSFDEGAIYPLLHEYERRGLVHGYWENLATSRSFLLGGAVEHAWRRGGRTEGATPARLSPHRPGCGCPQHERLRVAKRSPAAIGRVLGGVDGVLDPGWRR